MKEVKDYIVTIPDFPEKGIMFRDITSVLTDADGLQLAVNELMDRLKDVEFDAIVGLESRGFVFAMPLAYNLHKPFIMVRKAGKLPRETISETYDLEYGHATMEVHKDDLHPGERVIIVDDLLATGGTMAASIRLVERLGCKVEKVLFLMELEGLKGRENLKGYAVESVVSYPGK